MKHLRPLLLALSTLTLLAACSQPEDVVPGLEPQFGTSGKDDVTAVSLAPNGIVTKAVSFTAGPIESPNRPPYYRTKLVLRQLDSASRLLRQMDIGIFECAGFDFYDCDSPTVTDVKTDSLGNIFAMTAIGTAPGDLPRNNYTLYKYSPTGTLLWKKALGAMSTGEMNFSFDRDNNVFVAQNAYEGLSYVTRYNPNGVK